MSIQHDQVRSLSALALAASTRRLCSLIALQNLGELSTDRGGAAEARSCLTYHAVEPGPIKIRPFRLRHVEPNWRDV